MFSLFKNNKKLNLMAPITGAVETLKGGNGVIINPLEGLVVSPCDGQVVTIASTKHAIEIEAEEGIVLNIQLVGENMERLKGDGFKCHVEPGQEIKKGERLLDLDLEFLKNEASLKTSIVIDDMGKVATLDCVMGTVKCGIEPVMKIKLK
jgi:sugar PTS system EIIA component